MTDLPDIAHDFARRCLGWQVTSVTAHAIHAGEDFLLFNNFDAIMRGVKRWLERHHDLWFYMEYGKIGKEFIATYFIMDEQCLGVGRNSNHCHALLEACTNAQRKIGHA